MKGVLMSKKMKGVLIAIGVIVLIVSIIAGNWLYRYYTAEIRGVVDAEEQIESAPSRISRYEEFYNRCASIQGHEDSIAAQEQRLQHIDPESSEASRVRTIIAGLHSERARAIRRYNTDAANSYTMGRFRASNLPYRLDIDAPQTHCTD